MSRLSEISSSPTLREFAQGAAQSSIMPVADFLAPTIEVATSTGRYKVYTEKNRFSIIDGGWESYTRIFCLQCFLQFRLLFDNFVNLFNLFNADILEIKIKLVNLFHDFGFRYPVEHGF